VWGFYVARAARIAPVYLAAMWLSVWLAPVDWWLPTYQWILNALFLQAWVPSLAIKLNFPAWSLSVEAFFYLVFPWLLLFVKRRSLSPRGFLSFAALFWLATQAWLIYFQNHANFDPRSKSDVALYSYLPLVHLCSFFLGMAGGLAFMQHAEDPKGRWQRNPGPCSLALAVLFASLYWRTSMQSLGGYRLPHDVSLYAPIFLGVIWTLAQGDNAITRVLGARPLVLLGEVSYSFYILQNPVNLFYRAHLESNLGLSGEQHFYAFLLLLLLTSMLSYFAFERPSRRLILWTHQALSRRLGRAPGLDSRSAP